METAEFWQLGLVSDQGLRLALVELLASGYRTEARIVAHIAEVEERKLHLREGSESLFSYCLEVLGLSSSEAFHRITAARVARRFPIVFEMLERREVHLTAVCLLRDWLTPENHQELLAEASDKTKLQVQELVARRFPQADVASRLRKNGSATFKPLSEQSYQLQLNVSAALKEKLERLRALTSHANPSGDLALLIEHALDIALEKVEKRRFAKTERPRRETGAGSKPRTSASNAGEGGRELTDGTAAAKRRHIPNATRREVAARDGLRCTYQGPGGCRCAARAFLQIHHEEPWARGGGEQLGNLRLLCAAHNRLLAERDFGRGHVAKRLGLRGRSVLRLDEARGSGPRLSATSE